MKKISLYAIIAWLGLLCGPALFISCSDDDSGETPDTPKEGLEVNHWIEETMRENYLWYSEIPQESKLNFDAEPETFFRSLLSLKDGKARNGTHHYYSYIEKNKDYVSGIRTSIDSDDTYGMEFVTFNMVDQNGKPLGYYRSWVLYVLPDSPAEEAGIKRGDWLTYINGVKLNQNNFTQLLKGPAIELTIMLDPSDENKTKNVALSASRKVEDNPLYCHTTLDAGGKKVGYLLYNHFTTGPDGFNDKAYDNEMKEILGEFASQNVDEFILDLRYNGGGYLSSATILASLLVNESHKNDIFGIETDNKGKSFNIRFSDAGVTTHLKLNRLFILTSSSTASASEAVINGLIPYYGKDNIILIGETTEGKNVGSLHYSDKKYEWAIQPIVMRITNKEGVSNDYSAGLDPNYPLDEFESKQLLPLGDPNEYMLNYALKVINGTVPSSRAVGSPKEGMRIPVYQSIERHSTNGVLLPPNYQKNKVAE